MNPLDLSALDCHDIALRLNEQTQAPALKPGVPIDVAGFEPHSGEVTLALRDGAFRLTVSNSDRRRFEGLPYADRRLAAVVDRRGVEVVLRTWRFAIGQLLPWDKVGIQVSASVLESIADRIGGAVDNEVAVSWLTEQFLIPSVHSECSSAVGHTTERGMDRTSGTLALVGSHATLDVRRHGADLVATRLAPLRHGHDLGLTSTIVTAQIEFSTGLASGEGGALLAFGQSEYLDRWLRYNEIELELERARADELGEAGYSNCRVDGSAWRITLHRGSQSFLRALQIGTGLRLSAAGSDSDEFDVVGNVEGVEGDELLLRTVGDRDVPPQHGTVSFAIAGAATVHRRRKAAAEALARGQVPLPELAQLLEMRTPSRRRVEQRLDWDSPAVRKIFGGGAPNAAQKRAIQLALNTPDMVVIQGPPGTGKTKVIAAIAARVAELMGDKVASQQVLLTSHQHDAVDNVAARTLVFGLPSTRHGGRHGVYQGSWLATWRYGRLVEAQRLLREHDSGRLVEELNWVAARHESYRLSPLPLGDAADLVEAVLERVGELVDGETEQMARAEVNELRRSIRPVERMANLSAAIRSIRVSEASHADDGAVNARRLLARLQRLDTEGIDLEPLELAAGTTPLDPVLEGRLRSLRDELLDRFAPPPPTVLSPQAHAGIDRAFSAIADAVREHIDFDGQGMALVLQRFAQDLERDPLAVDAALADYAPVVASTCQAAASLASVAYRGTMPKTFDTVIVDEAARANPLDLQIPLTLASRRVVLVGDQRQLPHLVDEEVAHAASSGDAEAEQLKESLFGRLFRHLNQLRSSGGPDRTVTLDIQYRMHPTLGRFVSEQFYEPHGSAVQSPRGAEEFEHGLAEYAGRCAAWQDVPATEGREHGGQSKSRSQEAKWIASEVRRLMEEAPTLSFGVISFYSAQSDEILNHLAAEGLADLSMESEDVELRPEWKFTTDSDGVVIERLRVGTVDAFQGMEFDVVILSTVRTPRPESDNARASFGHLVVPNRLCVAMSRQRRLLIVVGDQAGLTEHPDAHHLVPALVAFRQLAESELRA